jgi:hypothetical protein
MHSGMCADCVEAARLRAESPENSSLAPCNTGSPKLPTHAEVFAHVDKTLHIAGEREHAAVSAAYGFICRQLQVGA